MAVFKEHLDTVSTSVESVCQQVKPAAKECWKLIPLYWLYCIAPVPVHLIFLLVLMSTCFGWRCVQLTVTFLERTVDNCFYDHKESTTMQQLFKQVYLTIRPEKAVNAFWWIRFVVYCLYLVWAAWKGHQIIQQVRISCKTLQQKQRNPHPDRFSRSIPGTRLMVLEHGPPMPKGLGPNTMDVFGPPSTLETKTSDDGAEWSAWREE